MKIYCISIYNENYNFFRDNNLIPVGVGDRNFDHVWLDDKGKFNISSKNANFGEYTFHYNLWKNNKLNNDWIGFCTYRRFWVKQNYSDPKTIKDLGSAILKEVPSIWKDHDVILAEPLRLGKQKLMKLLKNNLAYTIRKPSLMFRECTIEEHFNLYHGSFFLDTALDLLEPEIKKDFKIYLNSFEFNPHNLFICKNPNLLSQYYDDVFTWLFKCEQEFKDIKLNTFGKKRIYGFLAERYLPFWFKRNCNTLDWPYVYFDTNLNK